MKTHEFVEFPSCNSTSYNSNMPNSTDVAKSVAKFYG